MLRKGKKGKDNKTRHKGECSRENRATVKNITIVFCLLFFYRVSTPCFCAPRNTSDFGPLSSLIFFSVCLFSPFFLLWEGRCFCLVVLFWKEGFLFPLGVCFFFREVCFLS